MQKDASVSGQVTYLECGSGQPGLEQLRGVCVLDTHELFQEQSVLLQGFK